MKKIISTTILAILMISTSAAVSVHQGNAVKQKAKVIVHHSSLKNLLLAKYQKLQYQTKHNLKHGLKLVKHTINNLLNNKSHPKWAT